MAEALSSHDLLIKIAESVDPEDLSSLRLVSRGFHAAVGAAVIFLQPSRLITDPQLLRMCAAFPNACTLSFVSCASLTPGCLQPLTSLWGLLEVGIHDSPWATKHSLAPLVEMPQLQRLAFECCPGLEALPDGFSSLTSLRELSVFSCERFVALPGGIGGLSFLSSLMLLACNSLQELPESITQLSALEVLRVDVCIALQSIPAGIRALSSLKVG